MSSLPHPLDILLHSLRQSIVKEAAKDVRIFGVLFRPFIMMPISIDATISVHKPIQ